MAPHPRQTGRQEHQASQAWEEIVPIIGQQPQPPTPQPGPQPQDILSNILNLLGENGQSLYIGDGYGITRRILLQAVLAIFDRNGTPASRMAMLLRVRKLDILDLLLILSTKNASRDMESIQDYVKLRMELAKRLVPKQPKRSLFSPFRFQFVRRAWDYIVLGRYHLSDIAMEDMPTDVKSVGVRILLLVMRTTDNMPDWEKVTWLCMSAFTILMANSVRLYGKHAIFWKLLYGADYPSYSPEQPILNQV